MKGKIGLIVLLAFLCSCGAKMPLAKPGWSPGASSDSAIGIFTIETHNDLANYPPRPLGISVEGIDGNGNVFEEDFDFDDEYQELGKKGLLIQGSVELKPGEYKMTKLKGVSGVFPVAGSFFFDPKTKLVLRKGEVVYLGRMVARLIRKTSRDQERAGPILPILDQVVTGFSRGTFTVDIEDRFDEDIARVKAAHPALAGKTVTRGLMQVVAEAAVVPRMAAEEERDRGPELAGNAEKAPLRNPSAGGKAVVSPIEDRLSALDALRSRGVITKQEYDLRRSQILQEL